MKQDKIQEAYDKMLEMIEAKSYKDNMSLQEIIKNMDSKFAYELKEKYYAVSDNIGGLVALLAHEKALNDEYKNAKAVLYSFNKMNLGKYI